MSHNDNHKDDKAGSEKAENKLDFGSVLSEARKARNHTVEDISRHTKIPVHTISVIEANDIDALPPPTFTRGYIRAYAKFLEISEDKVVEKYNQAVPHTQTRDLKPRSNLPGEASSQSPLVKMITMLLIVAGIAAVIFGGFKYYQEKADVMEDALDAREQSFTGHSLDSPGTATTGLKQDEPYTEDDGLPGDQSASYEDSIDTEAALSQESETGTIDGAILTDTGEDTATGDETRLSTAAREAEKSEAEKSEAGAGGNDIVEIIAENGSWVEVRDANKSRLFYNMVPVAGNKVLVGEAPFSITMGNAKTTRVVINDIEVNISDYIRPNNTAIFSISTSGQDIIFH